jgi:hypothetical protein
MVRTRITVVVGLAVAVLGLAACGSKDDAAAASVGSPEAQVLAAMGFDMADLAVADQSLIQADPSPSASPAGPGRKKPLRPGKVRIAKNVLHGEVVVETKDGIKTVAVQRGTVTAIDDKTVTVKSSDGFTQTWTFGTPIRVVEHRTTVQPSAIAVGTQIGLAGVKAGSTVTARLIVIPRK